MERRSTTVDGVKASNPRNLKLIGAAIGFLGFLAALIILIILIVPPDPAGVVLAGSHYADNLLVPPNVLGWRGLLGVADVTRADRGWSLFSPARLRLVREPVAIEQRESWDRLIDDLAKRGFRQKTILIMVGLHGGSDPSGAYLIPGRMGRLEDRLDMGHVIETLGKLPAEKTKVLVLDAAQPPAVPALGMLHNDFARRIRDLEPEIRKVKNLWVLSSADVDQRSWGSEGLGRTAFGHYLIEALRGNAAGVNGRLTLEDLAGYVGARVRRWSWVARGAIQEPLLLPRPGPATADGGETKGTMRPSGGDVLLASAGKAAEDEPPPTPKLDDVRALWGRFGRLDAAVPHPGTHSPRRWREYRAHLVRYEQLVRTGGEDLAGPIRDRIDVLERSLQNERQLDALHASAENSLVLKALSGSSPRDGEATPPEFATFWNAPRGEQAVREWERLRAAAPAPADRSLRMRLDDFLLRRAIDHPVADLGRAADMMAITRRGSPFDLQPAEIHYLRMLARWPEKLADRDPRVHGLAGQSLRIRRLAERAALGLGEREDGSAYTYPEQVRGWIAPLVIAADGERRRGEDLLLSSEPQAWERAGRALSAAERGYREAIARAGHVRAALGARDRATDILAEYADWLPHRHPQELENDKLVEGVGGLFEAAHLLTDRLERPGDDASVGALAGPTNALIRGLDDLTRQFADHARRADTLRRPEDWEADTSAACVPFADSAEMGLRGPIWARLGNIREHDLELAGASTAGEARRTDQERQLAVGLARRRVSIRARLALARLGVRWFDDPQSSPDPSRLDFATASKRLRQGSSGEKGPAEGWWRDVATVGAEVGRRIATMAPLIDLLASEEKGVSDPRVFQERLVKADRLARLLEGSARRADDSAPEASARLRQARVHDALLAMAERTRLDHWYDEDPKDRPYYVAAGIRLLDDAMKLFPESAPARLAREQLARGGKLGLDGPDALTMTSEKSLPVSYRLNATGEVPPGIPVVRPVAGRLLELDDGNAGYRGTSADARAQAVEMAVRSRMIPRAEEETGPDRPVIEETSLRLEGSFRGQPIERTTAIRIHPVADTVAIGPAPADPTLASLAVRASGEIIGRFGEGTGSVAIVLDCSGSMEDPPDNPKFPRARKAIAEVLRQSVPQGTVVSLWTFSQAAPGEKDIFEGDPRLQEPERTIQRLRAPARWDVGQIGTVNGQLGGLRPFFETPLIQAMSQAAATDLKDPKGLKTLLVLTDGEDNRFANVPAFNRGLSIPDYFGTVFKSQFPGVRVNMVFFTPAINQAQLARARSDFVAALRRLDPPGEFVAANDLDQLIASLRRLIRQRLACEVLRPDGTPVGDEPLEVTGPGVDENWLTRGLTPGIYTLRVHADRTYEQKVDLGTGDRLIVELVDGADGGIAFRRALFGDGAAFRARDRAEAGGWQLTALSDQGRPRGGGERLQLLAALERKAESDGGMGERLRQERPGLAWFRLGAQDVPSPEAAFALRWHERIFYPGPTWHITVPRWIGDPAGSGSAAPILEAWWRESGAGRGPAPEFALEPAGNTQDLPREIQLDEGKVVVIESIGVEDHQLEERPGEPRKTESCLVVRLAFPERSPTIVDPSSLRGLQAVGYEHRLYTRARKYTGLFWPINQPQLQQLAGLRLIDLSGARDAASRAMHSASLKLPRPRVDDPIPEPITIFKPD